MDEATFNRWVPYCPIRKMGFSSCRPELGMSCRKGNCLAMQLMVFMDDEYERFEKQRLSIEDISS